jgi:hypothetical protein
MSINFKKLLLRADQAGYADKILGLDLANLIGYWPLWEPSGSVADNYQGIAARDGSYTGVTLGQAGIGDGRTCPYFDGANDYVDVYSDSLRDAFSADNGTIMAWAKVSGANIWTDDQLRWVFFIGADNNNRIQLVKTGADGSNKFAWLYKAGGTKKEVSEAITPTDWFHVAFTWDTAADEAKAYYNGAQIGDTLTDLGTWAGNLASGYCFIGSFATPPNYIWSGWIAHPAVWTVTFEEETIAIAKEI